MSAFTLLKKRKKDIEHAPEKISNLIISYCSESKSRLYSCTEYRTLHTFLTFEFFYLVGNDLKKTNKEFVLLRRNSESRKVIREKKG